MPAPKQPNPERFQTGLSCSQINISLQGELLCCLEGQDPNDLSGRAILGRSDLCVYQTKGAS